MCHILNLILRSILNYIIHTKAYNLPISAFSCDPGLCLYASDYFPIVHFCFHMKLFFSKRLRTTAAVSRRPTWTPRWRLCALVTGFGLQCVRLNHQQTLALPNSFTARSATFSVNDLSRGTKPTELPTAVLKIKNVMAGESSVFSQTSSSSSYDSLPTLPTITYTLKQQLKNTVSGTTSVIAKGLSADQDPSPAVTMWNFSAETTRFLQLILLIALGACLLFMFCAIACFCWIRRMGRFSDNPWYQRKYLIREYGRLKPNPARGTAVVLLNCSPSMNCIETARRSKVDDGERKISLAVFDEDDSENALFKTPMECRCPINNNLTNAKSPPQLEIVSPNCIWLKFAYHSQCFHPYTSTCPWLAKYHILVYS